MISRDPGSSEAHPTRSQSGVWHEIRADAKFLLKEFWKRVHRRKWLLSASTSLLALICLCVLWGLDDSILEWLRAPAAHDRHHLLSHVAGTISHWGDFLGLSVLLAALLWAGGKLGRSHRYRQIAVASMVSALLAGAAVNVIRFSVGRPRPSSPLPDGFYGPHLKNEFHAFPSAHTATALGSTLTVLIAAPPVGVPVTLFACSVAWSRMYLNQHHPSDILFAAWLAAVFGVPMGLAIRRVKPKKAASTEPER